MSDNRDIIPIEINLSASNDEKVNEIWLQTFGWAVKRILSQMFGGSSIPVNIRGSKREVSAFAKAIARDKKYISTAAKYGLNDPRVYKDKFKLRKAAANFERVTGIKYPFGG